MAYTTIDNPELYFQTKLYAGNSTARSITFDGSENMQPDWVWIKERDDAINHYDYDSVRGVDKRLQQNITNAEDTTDTSWFRSFDTNGFTIGTEDNINDTGDNYVAWCWKAGTSFSNDASATGVGSIDSSGSVNETAGFSICTYTGVSSAGTIKHGLSTVPSMIIWKNRSASNGWIVYHHKNTSAPETDYLELHSSNGTNDLNTIMNDTAPTSSVFSIGTEGAVGGSNTNNFVAYVFAEKQGYSKFGNYTGNGNNDGTFVYTGFKPAWVVVKASSRTGSWCIQDNKRPGYNPENYPLFAESSGPEDTSDDRLDLLSNGFKIRDGDATSYNESGSTYIYMAFAESPFVNSKGVPNNAR